MSPLSPTVLGAAAVVASPALWASLVEGTMAVNVALTRYAIAVGLCWALLNLVVEFAFSPAPREAPEEPVGRPAGATAGGPDQGDAEAGGSAAA